jgi:ankyrin repeat protein
LKVKGGLNSQLKIKLKVAFKGHGLAVQVLVEKGADVHAQNNADYSALFIAETLRAKPEMRQLLKDTSSKR